MLTFIKSLYKAIHIVLMDKEKMLISSTWIDQFFVANGMKAFIPNMAKMFELIFFMRDRLTSPLVANYGKPCLPQ